MTPEASKIEVIIRLSNGGCLTPEDMTLIEAIQKHRSISAAGRVLNISYRKCWLMADALNRTFETPVFATFPGRHGGGAEITAFGQRLIALYKSMQRRADTASKAALEELAAALDPDFKSRANGGVVADQDREPQRPLSRRT
ncbi:MAG: LysR family transcriptional regulator [Beijerinckiaceae bacterium]|nr:LysR family transcriptional regulator [Beijerinckiaceae bacterium]